MCIPVILSLFGGWQDYVIPAHPDLIDGNVGAGLPVLKQSGLEKQDSLLALCKRSVNSMNSYRRERHLLHFK